MEAASIGTAYAMAMKTAWMDLMKVEIVLQRARIHRAANDASPHQMVPFVRAMTATHSMPTKLLAKILTNAAMVAIHVLKTASTL